MTNTLIVTDAQDLEIDSQLIEVYELEIGAGSTNKLFFHAGKVGGETDLIFDGNTYITMPIFMDGIDVSATGASARPTLTIANVESIMSTSSTFRSAMAGDWDAAIDGIPLTAGSFKLDSLIGARITRRRTLLKYTGAGTSALEFDTETFIIDRISTKNALFVELELASPMDLGGVRLPRRQVIGKYCPWTYQGGIANPAKSACSWPKNKQLQVGNNAADTTSELHSYYFTGDDEPLVLFSHLNGTVVNSHPYQGEWNSSTTYSKETNMFVRVTPSGAAPTFYRCEGVGVVGADHSPITDPVKWQRVRTYTAYNAGTTYTIDSVDSRKNSYVKYPADSADTTIWRAVSVSVGVLPGTDEGVWTRGDTCGKLLKSCRIRYQVLPAVGGTAALAADSIPNARHDNNEPLPFGGFPGTTKFR